MAFKDAVRQWEMQVPGINNLVNLISQNTCKAFDAACRI